jgi:hypothetical protein
MEDKIVRFKMRVIDNDRSEPTLSRIAMNSVMDTEPKTEEGKYVPGEPQNTIRFQVRAMKIAELFVQGQDYYVDFVPTFQEQGSNEEIDEKSGTVAERAVKWEDKPE